MARYPSRKYVTPRTRYLRRIYFAGAAAAIILIVIITLYNLSGQSPASQNTDEPTNQTAKTEQPPAQTTPEPMVEELPRFTMPIDLNEKLPEETTPDETNEIAAEPETEVVTEAPHRAELETAPVEIPQESIEEIVRSKIGLRKVT